MDKIHQHEAALTSYALERLSVIESVAAKIVETRLFAGLSVEEAAAALGLARATAYREWSFARAWLAAELADKCQNDSSFKKALDSLE